MSEASGTNREYQAMNPCINCSLDSQGCHESGFCDQCPHWKAWKAELAIFKAGFYLEEDEDFLYLKRNGEQVAVWNSTRATTPAILAEMNRIVATERH
jgi:hypothetical protein